MARAKVIYTCADCGQQVARWVGRCPGCNGWGTMQEVARPAAPAGPSVEPVSLASVTDVRARISTGSAGIDRVLGGGLVPASVALLFGPPGIGKSTLLLQILGSVAASGRDCLLVSGEESHGQVAARAQRLGIGGNPVRFAPGRDLGLVLETARAARTDILAVDSIQTIRDSASGQAPGGVAQVRACTDALVGLAKAEGTTILLTGHITKGGDVAGPRALEHEVDVLLGVDGDPRSGLRTLSSGKNRFGAEGETAWFEMGSAGLAEVDPADLLLTGSRVAGAAVGLPLAGRRALAVEIQALVTDAEGPPRRQVTGLDLRRFQLVAAVLGRARIPLGGYDLFGATAGGVHVDDPACDLAVAAAVVSARTGVPLPERTAFVGEVTLTGLVRPVPGMPARMAAARGAGCTTVVTPPGGEDAAPPGMGVVAVADVAEAVARALRPAGISSVVR